MAKEIEIQSGEYIYRFVEIESILGNLVLTYCSFRNSGFRQSCTTFNNFEEARAWVKQLEEKIRNYKPMDTNISIPHEYDDCSKYYGD